MDKVKNAKRTKIICSQSTNETMAIAKELGKQAGQQGIRLLFLEGNLGAGKTVFVKGLAKALGVHRPVKSPSFVLVAEYPGALFNLIHADLYRIEKSQVPGLNLREYLEDPKNVLAIEWAEKLPKQFFAGYPKVTIRLTVGVAANERRIVLSCKM